MLPSLLGWSEADVCVASVSCHSARACTWPGCTCQSNPSSLLGSHHNKNCLWASRDLGKGVGSAPAQIFRPFFYQIFSLKNITIIVNITIWVSNIRCSLLKRHCGYFGQRQVWVPELTSPETGLVAGRRQGGGGEGRHHQAAPHHRWRCQKVMTWLSTSMKELSTQNRICLSFLLQRNKDLVTALKEVEQVDNPRKLTSWISRGLHHQAPSTSHQAASSRPPLECKSEENKRCCCLSHQVGVKLTRMWICWLVCEFVDSFVRWKLEEENIWIWENKTTLLNHLYRLMLPLALVGCTIQCVLHSTAWLDH